MPRAGGTADTHAARCASVAVRCFGMAALLSIVFLTGKDNLAIGVSAMLGGAVLLLAFDRQNPLSLRNFFLVYTLALFALGIPLLDLDDRSLYGDLLVFVVAFLFGYALSSLRNPTSRNESPTGEAASTVTVERVHRVEELLLGLACLTVLFLAVKLVVYGVGSFYSGEALIDQFRSYGQASVSGGITQIVNFFLRYTTIAAVVLYAQTCIAARVSIRYRYPFLVLVALPILLLARYDALTGAGLLLVIYSVERRLTAVRAVRDRAPGVKPPGTAVRRRSPQRSVALTTTMVVALLAAMVIGGLRQSHLAPQPDASALERSVPLLQSEFTPIQAYSEIKHNEDLLGRRYGSTIVWPLILKVVPRGLFPEKPINSGAYYMTKIRPLEFAAGYALPPTFFGDARISFGFWGAVLACFLLGGTAARLDLAYKEPREARVGWFLIVYANFYSLMRNAHSESLAGILLTVAVWFLIRRFFLRYRKHSSSPTTVARVAAPA